MGLNRKKRYKKFSVFIDARDSGSTPKAKFC